MDSDLDLDAIGAKAQFVLDHPYNPAGQERIKTLLREDVPALVAECRWLKEALLGLSGLVEDAALLPQVWRLMGEEVDRLRADGNRMDAAILEVALEAWRRREEAGEGADGASDRG